MHHKIPNRLLISFKTRFDQVVFLRCLKSFLLKDKDPTLHILSIKHIPLNKMLSTCIKGGTVQLYIYNCTVPPLMQVDNIFM